MVFVVLWRPSKVKVVAFSLPRHQHQFIFGHRRSSHNEPLEQYWSTLFRNDPLSRYKPARFSLTRQWYSSETLQTENDSSSKRPGLPHPPSGSKFEVTSPYQPMGDQPQAIDQLVKQIKRGDKYSILRGATGTGKTFCMAHTIARIGKPTLVLCHNKTLAAQLARELRSCLKKNHVHLFVSYYNHYVPESYNEVTDRYTAKKSSINDELDALRHMATRSLLEHEDVVVVSSVSCIYGLGMPKAYLDASIRWNVGDVVGKNLYDIQSTLEALLYSTPEESPATGMTSQDLGRGNYQWSYNTTVVAQSSSSPTTSLMIWPPSHYFPMTVTFQRERNAHNGEDVYRVATIEHGHTSGMNTVDSTTIFPAKHHISGSQEEFEESLARIQDELQTRVKELRAESKNIEADRLSHRVSQDLLLLRETGTCPGVENYSRHFALREEGMAPDTLLEYLGYSAKGCSDWLLLVDESHVTLPQLKAMYGGDRSRKKQLVKHGYRLPSALDNRPLRDSEFWQRVNQAIFVSATPAKQELNFIANIDDNEPVDMVIRPTYVCDPEISIRPTNTQLDDVLKEVRERSTRQERTLVITLTKRESVDMCRFLNEQGVSASYVHSGLNTHERSNALKSLQSGEIDCLVGVNLLREGLDLPEVSLVAILNADSEGFLRSEAALIQTSGRASRNKNGLCIFYANRVTESMQKCMEVMKARRALQLAYNEKYGTEPKSTEGSSVQSIFDLLRDQIEAEKPLEVVATDMFSTTSSVDLESTLPHSDVASLIVHQSLSLSDSDLENDNIVTDHLPSKPGIYFWKDESGDILYIGKAKKLRSRVKSYLTPNAKHSSRIRVMLKKAKTVEFILTPSDRDALILENKLIKHHSPPYNVLLKDDETYPYICATIGDAFPTFVISPRKQEGHKASKYKYFGPYPHFAELNEIIQGIEEKYDLRAKSFQAKFGSLSKGEYQNEFQRALKEVFETPKSTSEQDNLLSMRSHYEEASNLFESEHNVSRDVVVVGNSDDGSIMLIYVLQLREGMITGQFSYTCESTATNQTREDLSDTIEVVLKQRHYISGGFATNHGRFSFFPTEILVQYPPSDPQDLKETIQVVRDMVESESTTKKKRRKSMKIRTPSTRGSRKDSDSRALQCAIDNAVQIANEKALGKLENVPKTSIDGTAIEELASMLSLEKVPHRIECYDISHTQGENAVGSRVVFIGGVPAPHLYRTFNIRSVTGPDDYASIEEVLERRFTRAWVPGENVLVDEGNPWSLPDLVVIDGGKGQLSAALKGMAKANILPETNPTLLESSSTTSEYDNEDLLIVEDQYPPRNHGKFARVPVIALAKQHEEVFVTGSSMPVNNSTDSSALLLLRALRDESHRRALRSHRLRRKKMNMNGF
ncbi:excinuclease ABC subunit B [Nitzschia inconspicua]|uniref:Excinuclease ABC subunit B n=1 Tax=Nitzschia inconspicua TaxID=303405 RepID=A0A9K3L0F1_9STRA|nr:excinuclease ABC subunit B [Nitzschia inconspicua]